MTSHVLDSYIHCVGGLLSVRISREWQVSTEQWTHLLIDGGVFVIDVPGFEDNSLPEVGMVSKDGWMFLIDLVSSLADMFYHGTRERIQHFNCSLIFF